MDNLYNLLESCKFERNRGYKGSRTRMTKDGRAPFTALIGTRRNLKTKVVGPSNFMMKYPETVEYLHRLAESEFPDFKYTHITINKNMECKPHRDRNNVGDSIIFTVGEFTGGGLYIDNVLHNLYKQPTRFNGYKSEHWTEPFEGTRYTLIYYTNPRV